MSSPPLSEPGYRAGPLKRPVRSSAGSRWLQALAQIRKQLPVRSFVLTAWSSCSGPWWSAASELAVALSSTPQLTELERLVGPSARCCVTPQTASDVAPRTSRRAGPD
jgi:hypothetical protein